MAPVRADQRRASPGQLQRHGLQHSAALCHAAVRHPQHRLLQVEDEQGSRVHHVPPLFRLRGSQSRPRIRLPPLSERIDWSFRLLVFSIK